MSIINYLKPKWKNSSWSIRLTAVEKITSQALLAKIAIEDLDLRVRIAAVKKIKDQTLLSRILDIRVRKSCTWKIF